MAKVLYRFLEVGETPADGNLKLAFSSETPVLRKGDGNDNKRGVQYWEVLDHAPENADIKLLQNRGAFLDEHDFKAQIGVIESAEICDDKIGRAEVSFCDDTHSKDRSVQLRKKQRPHISFGYIQTRVISETAGTDNIVVKRFAWQAYEISSVAAPADSTVGVGRKFTREDEDRIADLLQKIADAETEKARAAVDLLKLTEAEKTARTNLPKKLMAKSVAELKTEAPELVAELEKTTRSAARVEIEGEFKTRATAATEKLKARNLEIKARADEFVKQHGRNWSGKPGEVVVVGERIRAFEQDAYNAPADQSDSEVRMEFTRKADELIRGSRAPKNQEEAALLPEEIASRCSLRAIYNAAAKAQERGIRVGAFTPTEGAEFEADKELRQKAREFPGGMAIGMEGVCLPVNMPGYRLRGSARELRKMTRDALAGDFPTAGALIAPEYKFPTIELLRNKMALGRAGMTILGGVIGNLVLPRQTAPTTSQSLAEGVALAAFDQVFDQIRMSPHRIGSAQKYSRLALLQTTEDFEALVMNDHMAQNALRADYLGVNGAGANDEPLGILNQIGIGVVTFAGSASSAYKNIIALETAIRKANIDEEPTYITTSTARGTLRITPATLTGSTVVSGETNALWVGDELVGRPAVDSQQIPNDVLLALVGRHLVMAQWGGWQIVLDTLTLADQDKIKLSMNTYIDYALRHPQAVARSADSLAVLS